MFPILTILQTISFVERLHILIDGPIFQLLKFISWISYKQSLVCHVDVRWFLFNNGSVIEILDKYLYVMAIARKQSKMYGKTWKAMHYLYTDVKPTWHFYIAGRAFSIRLKYSWVKPLQQVCTSINQSTTVQLIESQLIMPFTASSLRLHRHISVSICILSHIAISKCRHRF